MKTQRLRRLFVLFITAVCTMGCGLLGSLERTTLEPTNAPTNTLTRAPATPTRTPTRTPIPTAGLDTQTPTSAAPVDTPSPATELPASPTPEPTPGPTASLEIINDSGTDIWRVYLSPSGSGLVGQEVLGDAVIPAGGTHTLTGIPYGTYDVLAEGVQYDDIEMWTDATLDRFAIWTVTGRSGDTATLTIINRSTGAIAHVYLAPSYTEEWGEDLLGDHVIAPGERYTLPKIPFGIYDMKADSADRGPIDRRFEETLDGPLTWEVAPRSGSGPHRCDQWAFAATVSSERSSSDWSAGQASGEPDTPVCGDFPTAWASAAPDGVDWLEVQYHLPAVPRRINIHETHSPGFIERVEVVDEAGAYHTVWEGEPTPTDECPRLFSFLTTEINFAVVGVRIHVDQREGGNWNEIDAVELVGLEPW